MTLVEVLILLAAIVAGSALLTSIVRRASLRGGFLDHPNSRSSHVEPTARGGGIAIVAVASLGFIALWIEHVLQTRLAIALIAGGGLVALAGHLDDRGRIGIGARMAMHFVAAIVAVCCVGGLTEIRWGSASLQLGFVGPVIAVLGVVWALNLFNFMDGIDGIAASEAVFVAGTGGILAGLAGVSESVQLAACVIAAASLGFLFWNWPPARIFMGDVGSGYLGFCIAVLALASSAEHIATFNVWLILAGIFVVDATLTLVRRLIRRERVYQAHRSHAYQWQARRLGRHMPVTLATIALNALWLAPWGWLAIRRPELQAWAVMAALLPLCVLGASLGSGRRE
jgi:Fuc2NAc and GlcNAc transferase